MQSTPEAAPLSEGEELTPPTWQEHMRGPILGTNGLPLGQEQGEAAAAVRTRAGSGAGGRYGDERIHHRLTSGK